MKIKIHPLFFVVAACVVICSGVSALLSAFIAVLLHELFHACAARGRGYSADNILFLPYGAVLYNRDNLDRTSNIIIAISGPLGNFLLSLIFISLWWIFPVSYIYTKPFVTANLTIGFFNLLPVYPLDGARVILALFNYKPKTQKVLKISGVIVSLALAALFAASFKEHNYTLIIMAVFLFTAALSKGDKEDYEYMLKESPLVKDYDNGVTEKIVYISSDATLKKALLMIKPNVLITFRVVKNGAVTAEYTEKAMREVFNHNKLTVTFNDII